MEIRERMNLAIIFFIFTGAIFVLNQTLSLETKIQIYKFFACGSCPHQELKEQLEEWNQRINDFKQKYPEIDAQIQKKRMESEQCWKKLNANQLEIAKEELEACQKQVNQILEVMAQHSKELQNSSKRVLEQDLGNFEEEIVLD